MSTIVAVSKNGQACIAADSLTSFGDTLQPAEFVADYEKIIRFGKNDHIGIVGSAAHHLVMQNLLQKHGDKVDFSNRLSIFESMRQLHPILKEEYFLNSKDEDDDSYESSQGRCLDHEFAAGSSGFIRCVKSTNTHVSGRSVRAPISRLARCGWLTTCMA